MFLRHNPAHPDWYRQETSFLLQTTQHTGLEKVSEVIRLGSYNSHHSSSCLLCGGQGTQPGTRSNPSTARRQPTQPPSPLFPIGRLASNHPCPTPTLASSTSCVWSCWSLSPEHFPLQRASGPSYTAPRESASSEIPAPAVASAHPGTACL